MAFNQPAYVVCKNLGACRVVHQAPQVGVAKRRESCSFGHITDYALSKEIYVECINGHLDHVRCLFELNAEVSLSKTMQLLKGESAHWANRRGLIKPNLDWVDEYFAVSVVDKVRTYIANQEEHYKKITWADEYDLFLKKYGLRKDKQRKPK